MSTALRGSPGGSRGSRVTQERISPRLRPPARPAPRPRLRAVTPPQPSTRSGSFVTMLVLVLAGGLVGLLLLNTAMQRSAFELEELRTRAATLDVRSQVLDLQVERLRSPDRLASQAAGLGMVPVTSPGFVQLADGQVLGEPGAAVAGTGPQLVRVPPAPDVAEPTRTPAPSQTDRRAERIAGGSSAGNNRDTPATGAGQRRPAAQDGPQQSQQPQQSQRVGAGDEGAGR
ncbi:MAG: hypothetical protein H0V32_05535 [Nocardioidaceae bacterium]|nr:hypothetical protein [Nocardioidaceae bacterium]